MGYSFVPVYCFILPLNYDVAVRSYVIVVYMYYIVVLNSEFAPQMYVIVLLKSGIALLGYCIEPGNSDIVPQRYD